MVLVSVFWSARYVSALIDIRRRHLNYRIATLAHNEMTANPSKAKPKALLIEDDPVFRRRIAQRVELLAADLSRLAEPTAGELEQYFQDNISEFSEADRLSFAQVYFDPDARDEATLSDAKLALAQLQAAGVP